MVQLKHIFVLFALISIIKCQTEEEYVEEEDPEDAAIVSSVIYAPVPTNRVVDRIQVPLPEYISSSGEQKTICHNLNTDFYRNGRGWQVENSMQDTYDIDSSYGIKLNLLPPKQYIRKLDQNYLPYNEVGGRGPTLNTTTYMRYGKVSATIKSAGTGGSVTAFILLADGGDEIDFEFLGGDVRHVQSNYFWGRTVQYTINGGIHSISGGDIDKSFHKYTIEWLPDKIIWYVDDNVVRTKTKAETCDSSGNCKFPSQPARVQFGLWDGSIESGTAEWSKGPIDWSQPQSISAFIKDIRIECHPEYNQIVQ